MLNPTLQKTGEAPKKMSGWRASPKTMICKKFPKKKKRESVPKIVDL